MGVVYLAHERRAGLTVAVKLLDARLAGRREAARRFAHEARIVAALDHPRIVRTVAVEESEGRTIAIVTEFVNGVTLRELLREHGALPFDRATAILRDIAAALAHAHRFRVVHGDVKPENIYISEEGGRALLGDFGIARPAGARARTWPSGGLTTKTVEYGTPAYMAPEQIAGENVDERADVYALGLVGWEMLTGARPWEGESVYAILHKQQVESLAPLVTMRPEIPAFLLAAIEGATAKEPDDRWRDGGEFVARLTPKAAVLPGRSDAADALTEALTIPVWLRDALPLRGDFADQRVSESEARHVAESAYRHEDAAGEHEDTLRDEKSSDVISGSSAASGESFEARGDRSAVGDVNTPRRVYSIWRDEERAAPARVPDAADDARLWENLTFSPPKGERKDAASRKSETPKHAATMSKPRRRSSRKVTVAASVVAVVGVISVIATAMSFGFGSASAFAARRAAEGDVMLSGDSSVPVPAGTADSSSVVADTTAPALTSAPNDSAVSAKHDSHSASLTPSHTDSAISTRQGNGETGTESAPLANASGNNSRSTSPAPSRATTKATEAKKTPTTAKSATKTGSSSTGRSARKAATSKSNATRTTAAEKRGDRSVGAANTRSSRDVPVHAGANTATRDSSAVPIDAVRDERCRSPKDGDQEACLRGHVVRADAPMLATYRRLVLELERGGESNAVALGALSNEQTNWERSRITTCQNRVSAATHVLWGLERAPCYVSLAKQRESALHARLRSAVNAR